MELDKYDLDVAWQILDSHARYFWWSKGDIRLFWRQFLTCHESMYNDLPKRMKQAILKAKG